MPGAASRSRAAGSRRASLAPGWKPLRFPCRGVLADLGDVVEDQQMILVELCQCALESKLAPRHLQPLYKIAEQANSTRRRKRHATATCRRASESHGLVRRGAIF